MSVIDTAAPLVTAIHLRLLAALNGGVSVVEAAYAIAATLLVGDRLDGAAVDRLQSAMTRHRSDDVREAETRFGVAPLELQTVCNAIFAPSPAVDVASRSRALLAADVMSFAERLASGDDRGTAFLRILRRFASDPMHDGAPAVRMALGLQDRGSRKQAAEADDHRLVLTPFRTAHDTTTAAGRLMLTSTCDDCTMTGMGTLRVTGLLPELARSAGIEPKRMLRGLLALRGEDAWGWRPIPDIPGVPNVAGAQSPSASVRDGVLDLSVHFGSFSVTSDAARNRLAILVGQIPPPSVIDLLEGKHVSALFDDAIPLRDESATIIRAEPRQVLGRLVVVVNCPSVDLQVLHQRTGNDGLRRL